MAEQEDVGQGPPVPPDGGDNPLDFPSADIPKDLNWIHGCSNPTEYKKVIVALYSTLEVKHQEADDDGPAGDYLCTRFTRLTQAQLRASIQGSHILLANARGTPVWLYNMLRLIKITAMTIRGVHDNGRPIHNVPDGLRNWTRASTADIVESFNKPQINTVLRTCFSQQADDPEDPSLLLSYFLVWITSALESLTYIHRKTRLGAEFFMSFTKYKGQTDDLSARVTDMLLNLCSRTDVNQAALRCGETKQMVLESCTRYLTFHDGDKLADVLLVFGVATHEALPKLEDLKMRVENNTLWFHHYFSGGGPNFRPLSLPEVAEQVEILSGLLKDIRGYNPSPFDLAMEKAQRIALNVKRLIEDIQFFNIDTNVKTLGRAKTLFTSLQFYQGECNALAVEGVTFDQSTMGTDHQQLSQCYEDLFNFISLKEQELKRKEQQDRMEASEVMKTAPTIRLHQLRSVADWLNFKASLDNLMKFHSSDFVKSTMVRNALKDRADISRCQNLDYEGIMSYLNSRYNDSSLIPRLIDRLITMPQASNEKISYDNLTNFLSIYSQLQLHHGEDRFDKFVRDKLVPLLLPTHLQCDFLSQQMAQERKWKADHDGDLLNDSASTTFSLAQGDELEEKRRDNFVSSMKIYAEIIRRIVATQPSFKPNKNKCLVSSITPSKVCPVCNQTHSNGGQSLRNCSKFKAMGKNDRFKITGTHKFCKTCLEPRDDGKHANGCPKGWTCRACNKSGHHDMLCFNDEKTSGRSQNKSQYHSKSTPRPKGKAKPRTSNTHTTSGSGLTTVREEDKDDENVESHKIDVHKTREATTKSPHQSDSNSTRMFLSSCSEITLSLRGNQLGIILGLLDVGSGLNFILNTTAERLKLIPDGNWHGTISTVNGESKGNYPVYSLPIKDVNGKIHHTAAVGIQKIGFKNKIPTNVFNDICRAYKVNPSLVQNHSGEIEAIIGLESQHLLAHPSRAYHNAVKDTAFSGVSPYSTILSQNLLLVGAVGPSLSEGHNTATRMFHISAIDCYVTRVLSQEEPRVDIPHTVSTSQDPSQSACHSMLDIKKTAATLSYMDAGALPDLVCPSCKLIISKCSACRYLGLETSLKDLEAMELMKKNFSKIPDPMNPSSFFIHFDYVFEQDPKKLYDVRLSNVNLARKSALRLRSRLIKENFIDSFHEEMKKSLRNQHFAIVEGELKEKFDKLGVANYINFNYQIKASSLSQSIRPVSNSGAYHQSGDLNSKLLEGIQSINNPLHIIWNFLWDEIGWAADYSRAYRSVLTGDISNAVRRFFWFKDPHDESTLTEYCLVRLNYGDRPSSAVLEIAIRDYISPLCKLQWSEETLRKKRYIDDTLDSFPDHQTRIEVQEDIISASSKANFLVKHTLFSGCQPTDEDQTPYTNVLGQRWFFTTDEVKCNISLNTFPKKRGAPTGPELNEDVAQLTPLTKTILCRLAGQSFSYTQAQLLPITMCLRIAYSRVATLTQDWHEDVADMDPSSTSEIRKMLSSLSNISSKLQPVPRAICPKSYQPWRLCVSTDGSSCAAAAVIHMIVKSTTGCRSTNVVARGKIVKATVPDAELIGCVMGVKMMMEFIHNIKHLQDTELEVIHLVDSLCLAGSLNPQKLYKSVKVRNSCFLIHKHITDLTAQFPKITVKFCHVQSASNASDGASKMSTNPVSITNSTLWRHGPDFYCSQSWPPPDIVFLQSSKEDNLVYQPPVAQQHSANQSNCLRCNSDQDYCGLLTTICSQCHGADPLCITAEDHLDHHQTVNIYKTHSEGAQPPGGNQPPGDSPTSCQDQELDHITKFTLPPDTYIGILANSRSLLKVLGIVSILIRIAQFFNARRQDPRAKMPKYSAPFPRELKAAWRTIVRTSQQMFPPTNISSWFPFTDNFNIQRARTRYNQQTTGKGVITVQSPPLISHKDYRLATLLVRYNHKKWIHGSIKPVHLQKNITIGNMRNSNFPVELTRMNEFVREYITNCVPCIRLNSTPLTASLGTPRWLKFLDDQSHPYKIISIDPIGDYKYQVAPGARGPSRKCWVLVVSCLLTTATQAYIMQGLSKADVYRALHNHFQRTCRASLIYTDAGKNLTLNPADDLWGRFFGATDIDIMNIGTEEFFSSFVESKIKILKKMIKSAMNTRTANKLPNFTLTEYQDLFETLCNLVNSRPLFATKSGDFLLSPNHITKSWISLSQISYDPRQGSLDSNIDVLEKQLTDLCNSLQLGASEFMQSLRLSLLSDTKNLKILKMPNQTPRACDIVLISRRGELFLGVIETVHGQMCWVRRRKNGVFVSERINVRKIHILHRPYQSSTPPGQNEQVHDVRGCRGILQHLIICEDRMDNQGCQHGGDEAILQHLSNCDSTDTLVLAPVCLDDITLRDTPEYYNVAGHYLQIFWGGNIFHIKIRA